MMEVMGHAFPLCQLLSLQISLPVHVWRWLSTQIHLNLGIQKVWLGKVRYSKRYPKQVCSLLGFSSSTLLNPPPHSYCIHLHIYYCGKIQAENICAWRGRSQMARVTTEIVEEQIRWRRHSSEEEITKFLWRPYKN